MGKSIRTFFEDYNEMCIKPQAKWLKKHWKGYLVVLAASYAGGYAIGWGMQKIEQKKLEKYYKERYFTQQEDEEV